MRTASHAARERHGKSKEEAREDHKKNVIDDEVLQRGYDSASTDSEDGGLENAFGSESGEAREE